MNELHNEFYELAESVLMKYCSKINLSDLPDEDTDIAQSKNLKIVVHDVSEAGVYVYLCIHKNSGNREFYHPDLQETAFGYRAADEGVFINAVFDPEFAIWDINPPEEDDLKNINLERLNDVMRKLL